jgi:hypothetical protein
MSTAGVCPEDHIVREIQALRSVGYDAELVAREQESVGCVTVVTETYQTQTNRSALNTGDLMGLEPTDSEGIFRSVPRNARVVTVEAILVGGKVQDLTSNEKLRFVLTKKPYATVSSGDDIELMQLNNSKSATMSATPLEISFGNLDWMPSGENNSFRIVGRPTRMSVLATRNHTSHAASAHYIRDERYPALVFTSASTPVKQLPADVSYRISIVYEVVRSPDATELVVDAA